MTNAQWPIIGIHFSARKRRILIVDSSPERVLTVSIVARFARFEMIHSTYYGRRPFGGQTERTREPHTRCLRRPSKVYRRDRKTKPNINTRAPAGEGCLISKIRQNLPRRNRAGGRTVDRPAGSGRTARARPRRPSQPRSTASDHRPPCCSAPPGSAARPVGVFVPFRAASFLTR